MLAEVDDVWLMSPVLCVWRIRQILCPHLPTTLTRVDDPERLLLHGLGVHTFCLVLTARVIGPLVIKALRIADSTSLHIIRRPILRAERQDLLQPSVRLL